MNRTAAERYLFKILENVTDDVDVGRASRLKHIWFSRWIQQQLQSWK